MADNLARVREAIGAAPVRLVAVTKTASITQIEEAYAAGVTDFAENRVQDAIKKQEQLSPEVADKVTWHFIGHLQTNKINKVIGRFDLIHSIDSFDLAEEVSRAAIAKKIVQPVLLQVKMADDPNKGGFTPDDLKDRFSDLQRLSGIRVDGLMTIAPFTTDNTTWRFCFKGLQLLRSELESVYGVKLKELSMGMTQDYKEAIACGSTMVRLGRAIFD
ncbi:MAG: YggS family pyridoxal phosphate-dependent enzyme [Candidatus Obscuribacterales bacterium]|nr:YggS family pyridoxal phosphate-dependent enzyme [Candidatus Obscuribacterales bacterium]